MAGMSPIAEMLVAGMPTVTETSVMAVMPVVKMPPVEDRRPDAQMQTVPYIHSKTEKPVPEPPTVSSRTYGKQDCYAEYQSQALCDLSHGGFLRTY
jgi:hypothetical protein